MPWKGGLIIPLSIWMDMNNSIFQDEIPTTLQVLYRIRYNYDGHPKKMKKINKEGWEGLDGHYLPMGVKVPITG